MFDKAELEADVARFAILAVPMSAEENITAVVTVAVSMSYRGAWPLILGTLAAPRPSNCFSPAPSSSSSS